MSIDVLTNDVLSASLVTEPGGAAPLKLDAHLGQRAVNVKSFGVSVGTGGNDTAAIQAAIDERSGPVFIPTGDYLIDQIFFREGTTLFGASPGNASARSGSLLVQAPGINDDMIISDPGVAASTWIHWWTIQNLNLRGDAGSIAGSGINIKSRMGEQCSVERLEIRGFAESGIKTERGGTPLYFHNTRSWENGEYGFDFQRTAGDVWDRLTCDTLSGDE